MSEVPLKRSRRLKARTSKGPLLRISQLRAQGLNQLDPKFAWAWRRTSVKLLLRGACILLFPSRLELNVPAVRRRALDICLL